MALVELKCTSRQRFFLWAVLHSKFSYIGFGGARGGGKTFISCLAMVLRRLMLPGTRGLMLRQTQGAADQNLGEEIQRILKMLGIPFGSTRPVHYKVQDKQWHFPNGSYIQLGYCKTDTDWQRYQGMQFTDIAIEEATQFKEKMFLDLIGSNRTDNPDAVPKVWVTCNPGGIGTEWVKRRFIDENTRDASTVWIKSLLRENMALLENDPEYRDRTLARQPDWRRKQWEDGNWEAIEGQFFIYDPNRVHRKLEIPYWADVYAGVDAGFFPSSFAVVYLARWKDVSGKQHIHVFAEVKGQRWNLTRQAAEALEMERTACKNFYVRARFADPAAWKRTEADGGITASTAYGWAQRGFVVSAAYSNARQAGWLLLRTLFDEGILTIDPSCRGLIKELGDAIHDSKTDDIHDACEDHLLDALRYVLVSVFSNSFPERQKEPYEIRQSKRQRIIAVRSNT